MVTVTIYGIHGSYGICHENMGIFHLMLTAESGCEWWWIMMWKPRIATYRFCHDSETSTASHSASIIESRNERPKGTEGPGDPFDPQKVVMWLFVHHKTAPVETVVDDAIWNTWCATLKYVQKWALIKIRTKITGWCFGLTINMGLKSPMTNKQVFSGVWQWQRTTRCFFLSCKWVYKSYTVVIGSIYLPQTQQFLELL